MARTFVRAGLASARLALVAGEAIALAGAAIAGTLPSALDVLVMTSVGIGAVHPRQLIGAEATAAVATCLPIHAKTGETLAGFILQTTAITATEPGTGSAGNANERKERQRVREVHGVDLLVQGSEISLEVCRRSWNREIKMDDAR